MKKERNERPVRMKADRQTLKEREERLMKKERNERPVRMKEQERKAAERRKIIDQRCGQPKVLEGANEGISRCQVKGHRTSEFLINI